MSPTEADRERRRNQADEILALLRAAGPRGVSKVILVFEHRWTQAATRVHELESLGYVIRHDFRPGERFVIYVLESEPIGDWFTQTTGRERPRDVTEKTALPLLAASEASR